MRSLKNKNTKLLLSKTLINHSLSLSQMWAAGVRRGQGGCTWVGDLGRGGPGETGRSVWLELVSGLSGGLISSGGDGVLASRSGPESLNNMNEKNVSRGPQGR